MPTHIPRPVGLALASAVTAISFLTISGPAAASKPADLRVVTTEGKALAEHTQYTGKTQIKARGRADCFGEGTGGSGEKTTVTGATALGIVEDARRQDRRLDPLLVTDAFDFGLGLCGIGGHEPGPNGFWYLKVNHAASQTGGDQTRLKSGDEVLWYLIEDFNDPVPPELELKAPARADGSFTVRVWEYADDGSRKPAEGASVDRATELTDAEGRTTVDQLAVKAAGSPDSVELRAERDGSIPSNSVEVCVSEELERCQSKPPTTIHGSNRRDVIRGTRGNDEITGGRGRDIVRAKRGDDTIDVRGGGKDRVRCGAGDDEVRAGRNDVLKGCG